MKVGWMISSVENNTNREMKVIINATALLNSGGLIILKQFLEAIPVDSLEYIVFINEGLSFETKKENVKIIRIPNKKGVNRVIWDTFGISKWLRENRISPTATISLQNTNFRSKKNVPNFIYYHQSIPFFNQSWNPLKKNERTLWFYKNIYPFFVRLFINNRTEIFVQLNVIKDGFSSLFDFPKEKIHVINPTIKIPDKSEAEPIFLSKDQLNLFYPATAFIYKNHNFLFTALSKIEENLQKKITLYLTCHQEELQALNIDVKRTFNVKFLGAITYPKVLGLYNEADALVFPSYIETYGLPLIEAASFGIPILAADLPYAREVLSNYTGVSFLPHDNDERWKTEILNLFIQKGHRFPAISLQQSNSWKELFQILKDRIENHV